MVKLLMAEKDLKSKLIVLLGITTIVFIISSVTSCSDASRQSKKFRDERRARMTVLLLVRLAAAVLVILMCSWAMAIAWAAGTRGDGDGLVKGPMFTPETPVQRMPELALETSKAGNTHYPEESMAPRLTM